MPAAAAPTLHHSVLPEAIVAGVDPIIPLRRAAREYFNLSVSTIERRGKSDPTFPLRVALGPSRWGFRLSAIKRWLDARPVLPRAGETLAPGTPVAEPVRGPTRPGRRKKKMVAGTTAPAAAPTPAPKRPGRPKKSVAPPAAVTPATKSRKRLSNVAGGAQ
jgi:predicted DNA-binding transcriptional regulator AlpA